MIYYNNNTINDWDFGTSNINKVYLNNAVCYQKIESGSTPPTPSPSRLPSGYTEVEYIENTGTSYLEIDFKPNTNTRIVADMQCVTQNTYPRLFGSGTWGLADSVQVGYQIDGGQYCLHVKWFGNNDYIYYTSSVGDYQKHTYDLNKGEMYVDGTLVGSKTYSTAYQLTDNLGIFNYIGGGRPGTSGYFAQQAFKGKMYSFKIYDNGTLVRDLVPCINPSNVVGAYDIVNDTFYTVPSGYTTNTLVAGNPV